MIDDYDWSEILDRLREGKLIPIISNSFLLGQIFKGESCKHVGKNVDDLIAKEWVKESGYLLPDNSNLANVAQYNYFKGKSPRWAKDKYMNAFRKLLFSHLEECIPEKYAEAQKYDPNNISDFLNNLNLPDWKSEICLSRLVAIKDIKLFITTSYFNLLDRAFERSRGGCYSEIYGENDGNQPNIINFNGKPIQEKYDRRIMDYPLVYFIYGSDSNPEKMILAEDDHIKFLIEACQPVDRNKNTSTSLSSYIKAELNQNSLLFLGYRWQDWEFRTIFRMVTHNANEQYMPRFFIQLDPEFNSEIEKAKELFKGINYFTLKNFSIFEEDTQKFILELCKKSKDRQIGS